MIGIGDAASAVALVAAVAAATAVAVVARQRKIHTSGKPFLAVGLAAFGFAAVISAPAVIDLAVPADWVLSAVYQAGLMLEMAGSFCMVAMLIRSQPSPRASRRIRQHTTLLMACLVVMTALRIGTPMPPDPRYDQSLPATIVTFIMIRLTYHVVAMTLFAVMAYRVSRQPETDTLVRWGLQISCGATLIGLAYVVYTGWNVIGGSRTVFSHQTTVLLFSTYILTLAGGATATAWLPRLRAGFLRFRLWRIRRGLQPLWSRLQAGPDRLTQVDHLPRPIVAGKDRTLVELLRVVVGIEDRLQLLRPHAHPQASQWAWGLARRHGLDDDTSEIIAKAAEVATALDTLRREPKAGRVLDMREQTRGDADIDAEPPTVIQQWTDRRRRARRATDTPPTPYQGPDIWADARKLLSILHALRHSSVVATVRHRARRTPHSGSAYRAGWRADATSERKENGSRPWTGPALRRGAWIRAVL